MSRSNAKCTSRISLMLLIALFPGQLMMAGGFQINYQGLRQAGMANAGVGLAFDASCTFFNPGALSMNYQGGLLLGSSALVPRIVYINPRNTTERDTSQRQVLTPIYLYAAFKGKKGTKWERFGFGISLNNPFGGRVKWEENWAGRLLAREFSINTFFLQPTVSYQVSNNIGIGAGLAFGVTSLLKINDFKGNNGVEGTVQYTGTGRGVSLNLGLFAQLTKEVSLGVSYRSPIRVNIDEGEVQFEVSELQQDNYPNLPFVSSDTLPGVFNIGLGYKPDPRTQIAFEINFAGWDVFQQLDLKLADTSLVGDAFPNRSYMNSYSVRLGGEYALTDALLMRLGLYYEGTPVSNLHVHPEFPDANKIGFTGGLGYRPTQKISIDVSGSIESIGQREGLFDPGEFRGIYSSSNASFGIGIGYLF